MAVAAALLLGLALHDGRGGCFSGIGCPDTARDGVGGGGGPALEPRIIHHPLASRKRRGVSLLDHVGELVGDKLAAVRLARIFTAAEMNVFPLGDRAGIEVIGAGIAADADSEKSAPKADSIGARNDPMSRLRARYAQLYARTAVEGFARWFRLSLSLGSTMFGDPGDIVSEAR